MVILWLVIGYYQAPKQPLSNPQITLYQARNASHPSGYSPYSTVYGRKRRIWWIWMYITRVKFVGMSGFHIFGRLIRDIGHFVGILVGFGVGLGLFRDTGAWFQGSFCRDTGACFTANQLKNQLHKNAGWYTSWLGWYTSIKTGWYTSQNLPKFMASTLITTSLRFIVPHTLFWYQISRFGPILLCYHVPFPCRIRRGRLDGWPRTPTVQKYTYTPLQPW